VAAAKKKITPDGGPELRFDLRLALVRTREWLLDNGAKVDASGSLWREQLEDAALEAKAKAVWSVRLTLLARQEVYALPSLRSVLESTDGCLSVLASGTLAPVMQKYRDEVAHVINRAEALQRELERPRPEGPAKKGRPTLDPLRGDLATTLVAGGFTLRECVKLLAMDAIAEPNRALGLDAAAVAVDALRKDMLSRADTEEARLMGEEHIAQIRQERERAGAARVRWLAREVGIADDLAVAYSRGVTEPSEEQARIMGQLAAAAERFDEMSSEEQRDALASVGLIAGEPRRGRPKRLSQSE
jgi:hypothetical protein